MPVNSTTPEQRRAPDRTTRQTSDRHHVYLVDDEKLYLSSMVRLLRRLDLRTTAFDDPKEALRHFEIDPERCDLLITDYRMPGLLGTELARRVHGLRNDLPILVMSGYVDEVPSSAHRYGVCQVLAKPMTAEELIASVVALLPDREAQGAP